MKQHFVNNNLDNLKANSKALKTYKQCQTLTQADFAYFGLLTSPLPGFKRARVSSLSNALIKLRCFNNHLPYVLTNTWPTYTHVNNACVIKETSFLVPRICGGQINLSLQPKSGALKHFAKAGLSRKASELALTLLDQAMPKKTEEAARLSLAQDYSILGCVVIQPKGVLFISPSELKQSALVQSAGCAHPEQGSLKPLKKALSKQCLKPRLLLTTCVQRCIKLSLSQHINQPRLG